MISLQGRGCVGFDCEYAHFEARNSQGRCVRQHKDVAEVALVGESIIYQAFCKPRLPPLRQGEDDWYFVGGVDKYYWGRATGAKKVLRRVFNEIAESNNILVGHGIQGDLANCGTSFTYVIDTARIPALGGGTLKSLADHYLERKIQNKRHSAAQDAMAALDLYLDVVHDDADFWPDEFPGSWPDDEWNGCEWEGSANDEDDDDDYDPYNPYFNNND